MRWTRGGGACFSLPRGRGRLSTLKGALRNPTHPIRPTPSPARSLRANESVALDRVLYPSTGFTVADAVRYYEKVAPVLLPHIRNRPMSFKRYPQSVVDDSFWEKDAPAFAPKWVKRVEVPRRSGKSTIGYVVVKDLRTLRWIAEIGGIELHPFTHTIASLERPTHVVFDLDPGPGASILECGEVALLLRGALELTGLQSLVKTTGSKGLQLYVPLNTPATHELTGTFARLLAEELARLEPTMVTAKMSKQLRSRKVFIDHSQNASYKTNVAPYSLRAKRPAPFVSMPLEWRELESALRRSDVDALYFDPDRALKRAAKKGDPFATALRMKQKLPASFVKQFEKLPQVKPSRKYEEEEEEITVRGIRLPRRKSQGGRRLFVLPKTDQQGEELWLDVAGKFRRFVLRPDRESDRSLIAMPAGQFPIDDAWFRGKVQEKYRDSVSIEDIGAYEIVEGSVEAQRAVVWFEGNTLSGAWELAKIDPDPKHRSWRLRRS